MANTFTSAFHPVGEIFSYGGVYLKVVEGKSCAPCYFAACGCPFSLACTTMGRIDRKDVRFERYQAKRGGRNGRN